MIGAFGFTPQRNVLIDYPHPAALIPMALLIPKPMMNTRMNYVGAVWQPFQPQVS